MICPLFHFFNVFKYFHLTIDRKKNCFNRNCKNKRDQMLCYTQNDCECVTEMHVKICSEKYNAARKKMKNVKLGFRELWIG